MSMTYRCYRNLFYLVTRCISRTVCTQAESIIQQKSSLYKQIEAKVKAVGPITVAEYMREVLTQPAHGYYMNKDVFGQHGDFITSPEVSQLFGEMIAIWFIDQWTKLGRPIPLNLLEFGPGRGTMMKDILRVFEKLKLTNELSVHLVEVSNALSDLQGKLLCPDGTEKTEQDCMYYQKGVTESGIDVYWYKSLHAMHNTQFCLVLAHEFFDALPIHKFQKTENGWREVLIDIDPNVSDGSRKLRYVLSNGPTPGTKLYTSDRETRDHVEVCPNAIVCMQTLGEWFKKYGGIGLIVDYGHCGTKTDTFRAFRDHTQCDPLVEPGTADLTADVDFSSLKKAAENELVLFGPITQREFLTKMQITVRLQILLNACQNDKQKESLISGFNMLTDENQMGLSFKFLCFFPRVLEPYFERDPVYGF